MLNCGYKDFERNTPNENTRWVLVIYDYPNPPPLATRNKRTRIHFKMRGLCIRTLKSSVFASSGQFWDVSGKRDQVLTLISITS